MQTYYPQKLDTYQAHNGGDLRLFPIRNQTLRTANLLPGILDTAKEFGMRNVRIRLDKGCEVEYASQILAFKEKGFNVCLLSGGSTGLVGDDLLNTIYALNGAVTEVESLNEPWQYQEVETIDELRVAHNDIYTTIKSHHDPAIAGLAVTAPSIITSAIFDEFSQVDVTPLRGCDYGNWHCYASQQPEQYLDFVGDRWENVAGPNVRQSFCTEYGYHSALDNPDAPRIAYPDEVREKYLPRKYLDLQRRGFAKCFVFRLKADESFRPREVVANSYGLLDANGVELTGQTRVFRELATELVDTDPLTITPMPLTFEMTSTFPIHLVTPLLYQRGDGVYKLVLWKRVKHSSNSGNPVTVQLRFNDPVASITGVTTSPTLPGNPYQVFTLEDNYFEVQVDDFPTVLTITPDAAVWAGYREFAAA